MANISILWWRGLRLVEEHVYVGRGFVIKNISSSCNYCFKNNFLEHSDVQKLNFGQVAYMSYDSYNFI